MRSSSIRWLFASISFLIVCFVVSTFFIERKIARIEEEVEHIVTNSTPSVIELSSARSEARRVEVAAMKALVTRGPHPPELRLEVEQARAELDRHLLEHARTPFFPEEYPIYDALLDARRRFESALDRALALGEGQPARSEAIVFTELVPAANELSRAFEQLVAINAAHTERDARNIERIRRRAAFVAFVLDALATAFGLVLLYLSVRATRLSEQLLKADEQSARLRADSLDRFASRVAHDLGSPLATISTAAAAAELFPDDALRWVAKIKRSARLMNEMLQALWSLGQLRAAPTGERTAIAPVLTEVVDEVATAAEAAGAHIEVEPFPAERAVACSAGTLALVLSNLLQNAIKYGAGTHAHRISVRVVGDADLVRLEVEDTGPGVRPDMQERIFEMYVRADPTGSAPGLGLGLATLKHLVEMQGGAIGVRSDPGRGACFWVQLAASRG